MVLDPIDIATKHVASSASATAARPATTVHDLRMMVPDPIDTATKQVGSSASATAARADGTSAAAATKQVVSSASATSARADGTSAAASTQQDHNSMVGDLYYELLIFLRDALADVCDAPSPATSVRAECGYMVYVHLEAWNNRTEQRYYALFSEPALLKHKEIFDVLKYYQKREPPRRIVFSNGADEFTHYRMHTARLQRSAIRSWGKRCFYTTYFRPE